MISSNPGFQLDTVPSGSRAAMPSEVCSTISDSLVRSSRIASSSSPFSMAVPTSAARASSTTSSPSSKPSKPVRL